MPLRYCCGCSKRNNRYALLIHYKQQIPLLAFEKIKIEEEAHLKTDPCFGALRPVSRKIIGDGINRLQEVEFIIHLSG